MRSYSAEETILLAEGDCRTRQRLDGAKAPMEAAIEQMRRDIRMESASPDAFSIAFAYPDPVKAQRTTRALIGNLIAWAGDATVTRLDVLNPPSMPKSPTSPNQAAVIGSGLTLNYWRDYWRGRGRAGRWDRVAIKAWLRGRPVFR